MLLEWTDGLVLGHERMDDTHREFVDQLNALGEASDDEMLDRLDAFYAHTVAHFEQENEWMRAIAFPPAHCHTAEHEGVLEVMREVRRHLVEKQNYNVGRVLAREIADWFRGHAATMDAMLAQMMNMRGVGENVSELGCAHGGACS
ncbi:MAG: hemerythrin domain-containing protein [Burkholderiales bacterium]|nr:hemerythrin domain-containing protein [Burkholderiales bacterium]